MPPSRDLAAVPTGSRSPSALTSALSSSIHGVCAQYVRTPRIVSFIAAMNSLISCQAVVATGWRRPDVVTGLKIERRPCLRRLPGRPSTNVFGRGFSQIRAPWYRLAR